VRLAAHTGCAGAVELADAVAAQLAANQIEPDDALDLLYTACYLTEGISAGPCVHAARLLLATGRGPAALAVLCAGLGAADLAWRTVQLASLADAWTQAELDVPFAVDRLTAQLGEALQRGDLARAEQLGRLAVAIDPRNTDAHRSLGLALARQGKPVEAMHHLARAAPDQARELLASAVPAPLPAPERDPAFHLLDTGDFTTAAARLADPSWRVRRAALTAERHRTAAENALDVTPRARAAAIAVLADTAGATEREPLIARTIALAIREQAYFARDPVPRLGEQLTRDAFDRKFAARDGLVSGDIEPQPPPRFVDRVVVPGGRIERISDYVALLRDLAALTPREALAQFDLDDAAYLEVATAWGAAIAADPAIAAAIAAGLAKR
jgi:tetratricopeptide (TPR) repeat protein